MKKSLRRESSWLGFAIGLALLSVSALAAENYSDWSHSTILYLDTSPNGANISTTMTAYPVLIRLDGSLFTFAQARGKGQDIRFSKPDGTHLNYEIDRWDSAAGVAEIWVRVDTIYGNQAGQQLKMYWGNTGATDSSNGSAVYDASNFYVSVWHLGGAGTGPRANSVAGAPAATPVNYDGDENTSGMIGMADSLDGGAPGDYLNLGEGYDDFTNGFAFSVWVYPTAVKKWAHVLDLGNGQSLDNIILNRVDTTDKIGLHLHGPGSANAALEIAGGWVQNQWQQVAISVMGKNGKIYRNGSLIKSDTLGSVITVAHRLMNFLGRSNWAVDDYFQGKLDEAEISKTNHSDNWFKLAYQNQKVGQTLVTFQPATTCQVKFSVPADTTISEGGRLDLTGTADCSSGYSWSVISGPAPRILDPEVKVLSISAPRISGDTVLVYRFTSQFADSLRSKDVRVHLKEAIPEPLFTLPASINWNGSDSLKIKPMISNLAALKASRDSLLHWNWTVTGAVVDTSVAADALVLRSCADQVVLNVGLCLDNSGPATCHAMTVNVAATTSVNSRRISVKAKVPANARNLAGRRVDAAEASNTRSGGPLFIRPEAPPQ